MFFLLGFYGEGGRNGVPAKRFFRNLVGTEHLLHSYEVFRGYENLVGTEHLLHSYEVFTRGTEVGHRSFHLTTKHLTRLLTPKGGRRIQESLLADTNESEDGSRLIRSCLAWVLGGICGGVWVLHANDPRALLGVRILHGKNGVE